MAGGEEQCCLAFAVQVIRVAAIIQEEVAPETLHMWAVRSR